MDWYTPDPNVKELLENSRDALLDQFLNYLIDSFEQMQAQFSRCRKQNCQK